MNVQTSRAAEGLARRAFSIDDLDRMVETGVIGHDERLELIGGEIVPMAAKGNRHERIKVALNRYLGRHLPEQFGFAPELGWRIDKFNYLEPDFILYPYAIEVTQVGPPDALLVIEVANSSLGYDLGVKAGLYASLGVAEFWVIDVKRRETHVHRACTDGAWRSITQVGYRTPLEPLGVPGFAINLADLEPKV